jgi:hypothetical protein
LIEASWITFKEIPSVSMNPLPNHVSGNGSINALEVKCPGSLKVPMERIYELMVKEGCEEGSMNFCEHYSKEGHKINQCEGFYNKLMQIMIQGIL